MKEKTLLQQAWDFAGIPFRLVLFDQSWLPRFGCTTLEDERVDAVLPHVNGRLLDIGAGTNTLVGQYGNGVGVDIHDWGCGVMVVENTAKLPFADSAFDTITFIACLNHIPYRRAALQEARRLVKDNGRLIITMINPLLGDIGHTIWWYGEDRHRGGMQEGEVGGMWTSDIIQLCHEAGFIHESHRRFGYGLYNLYLFRAA
jgi:SAM-dependent methyltransferase